MTPRTATLVVTLISTYALSACSGTTSAASDSAGSSVSATAASTSPTGLGTDQENSDAAGFEKHVRAAIPSLSKTRNADLLQVGFESCNKINMADPTASMVSLLNTVMESGFTAANAGRFVYYAVKDLCPEKSSAWNALLK